MTAELDWERSEVVLTAAENFGRGVVLWRVFHYAHGLTSRNRLSWFPDREAAKRYMLKHPELTVTNRLKEIQVK